MKNKIYIISAVYPPEPVVSARTSYDVAQGLAQAGHSTTVITMQPNRPGGRLYAGYRRQLVTRETPMQNCQVLRLFSTFSPRSSLVSRMLENLSFAISSGFALLILPKPDVIYSNTWPILATGIVRMVAGLRHIPLVINVQDLYPESLIIQGRLQKTSWLYRFMMRIDRWIAKSCAKLIVISEAFAKAYREERGLDAEKISVIPNWIDTDTVHVVERCVYRLKVGIPNEAFVIIYGGNVGVAAGVEGMVKACAGLRRQRETWLVVAGSGSQLAVCREEARDLKAVRVHFHSPWETEETAKVLAAADVLLLPTRGSQTLASVPSKLISYMLACRPVLAQALPGTDTARVVEEAGCGWVVSPDDPEALAAKIEEIRLLERSALDEMGARGREYALACFTKEANLPKVIQILKEAEVKKR